MSAVRIYDGSKLLMVKDLGDDIVNVVIPRIRPETGCICTEPDPVTGQFANEIQFCRQTYSRVGQTNVFRRRRFVSGLVH